MNAKQHFNSNNFMKRLSRLSAPGNDISNADLDGRMNDVLFYVNMIKNGLTVNTGEHEALTRLFTGQKIYVDTRDISVAPHLMLDGVWEDSFTRILRRYLKTDSVFLDIGANLGYFGLIAGSDILEGSIHFFEPNPLLADYIRKTVSINGLHGRASVIQKAVGKDTRKLTLSIPGDYFGSATVRKFEDKISEFVKTGQIRTVSVGQTSIDAYVKEAKLKKVDVMKIDVEGFEESVYDGMMDTIRKNPGLIVFLEFSSGSYSDPRGFLKKLKSSFKHIYVCDEDLAAITAMSEILPYVERDGFVMLALSNTELL